MADTKKVIDKDGLTYLWGKLKEKLVQKTDIKDNLVSTDIDKPLSANQGKVLNDSKLSLSGGTMTGSIIVDNADPIIRNKYNENTVTIVGGTDYNNGGRIDLNGKTSAMNPGRVSFTAKDASGNTSSVALEPDGSFKQDGKKILISTDIVDNLTTDSSVEALSAKQGKILNDNKIDHYSTMPTASSSLAGKTVQYIGANTTTAPIYTHNYFYECKESTTTAGTYEWVQVNIQPDGSPQVDNSTIDFNASSQLEVKDGGITFAKLAKQSTTDVGKVPGVQSDGTWALMDPDMKALKQYMVMPTASIENLDKIVQFIGSTSSEYTNGFVYICVENSGAYKWVKKAVQEIPVISTDITVDATSDTKTTSPKAVKTYVDAKVSSTYKAAGTKVFENLPVLSKDILGNVYNVSNEFTTTADFVEGAGKKHPAGTNVVCVEPSTGVYKWDVLAGFVDLSNYYNTTNLLALTDAEIDAIVNT